jgi:hypothetical protein
MKVEFELFLKLGLPLHFLQREFPQLASAVLLTSSVSEQVISCYVAKRALSEASWDKAGIVSSRQLLESEALGGKQKRQDN